MNQSLGLLEVKGLLGAITMSDVMVKASNVHVVNIDRANGFGWFTVKVVGDVGAVQSAVEAGAMVAKEMGCFVSSKVIPRVSQTVIDVFLQEETAPVKEEATAEPVVETKEEVPSVPATEVKTPVVTEPVVETVVAEPAKTVEETDAEMEKAISELTNIVIGEESTPSTTEVAPKATGSKKSAKTTKAKKKSSSKK
jgi:propanediol utilization protein pduA